MTLPTAQAPGFVVWLTGLPASGKTTVARTLAPWIAERVSALRLLDSDEVREALTPQPRYTPEERDLFYRALGYLASLLTEHGVVVVVAATAPLQRHRDEARARIPAPRFVEVHVDCPPQRCRERDPKGLWGRADRGEIQSLPGAGAPYEAPAAPEVRVSSADDDAPASARQVLDHLEASALLPRSRRRGQAPS